MDFFAFIIIEIDNYSTNQILSNWQYVKKLSQLIFPYEMWNRTFPVFVIFVITFFYTQEVDCGDPVIPEHYNIKILVLFTDSKFEGIVDILVECKKETDNIKLHAASLNVSTDKITVKEADSSKEEQIKGIDIIKEDEFLVINLASKLTVNKKYSIHIEYEGTLKFTNTIIL